MSAVATLPLAAFVFASGGSTVYISAGVIFVVLVIVILLRRR